MTTTRYRGLDKPPNVPLDISDADLPDDSKFSALFQFLVQLGSFLLRITDVVNNLLRGKLNCTSTFTVSANVASTTISDVNIGGNSVIHVMPTTAHAAAELATLYFDTFAKGSCVAHHANNAQTDRVFTYTVIG